MKVAVILPAAGLGTRMGRTSAEKTGTSRKQFMLLDGSPILLHTVRKFAGSSRVDEIVVAVRSEDLDWATDLLRREVRGKTVRVVEGGNSRQESVENALRTLDPATTLVAVHDAVRPFIDLQTIDKVIDEAAETGPVMVSVRWLVSEQAGDDGLLAIVADLEAVEPGGPSAVQDAVDADLVMGTPAGGAHSGSSQRPAWAVIASAAADGRGRGLPVMAHPRRWCGLGPPAGQAARRQRS